MQNNHLHVGLDIKLKKILKDYQDQRQWAETWEMRRSRPPAPAEADVMGEEVMYVRDYTSYDDMVETLGDLVNTYPAIIDRWLPDNSSSLTQHLLFPGTVLVRARRAARSGA